MTPCTRCGKCCFHMGPYITIERSLSGREHYCFCSLSRDRFFVRVPPSLDPPADESFRSAHPQACPFLRAGPQDSYTCAIYASRPGHCRSFICTRDD